jgi:hypothetical protein
MGEVTFPFLHCHLPWDKSKSQNFSTRKVRVCISSKEDEFRRWLRRFEQLNVSESSHGIPAKRHPRRITVRVSVVLALALDGEDSNGELAGVVESHPISPSGYCSIPYIRHRGHTIQASQTNEAASAFGDPK